MLCPGPRSLEVRNLIVLILADLVSELGRVGRRANHGEPVRSEECLDQNIHRS